MTEEHDRDIEEIKEQIDIPVEEDVEQLKKEEQQPDVVEEMKRLGQQFALTIERAWNSQERRRVEDEVRQGVRSFADEVDKVLRDVRQSPTTERVKEEASTAKTRIEGSDVTRRAREGVVQGLSWLSEELDKLAKQFTPAESTEKGPEEAADLPPEDMDLPPTEEPPGGTL